MKIKDLVTVRKVMLKSELRPTETLCTSSKKVGGTTSQKSYGEEVDRNRTEEVST